jgi:hypothetical protein
MCPVNVPLTERILALIYRDSEVRRKHKDALTDWILDTQSRTEPLDPVTLMDYLALHQPELLDRLKSNVRLQEEFAQAPVSVE